MALENDPGTANRPSGRFYFDTAPKKDFLGVFQRYDSQLAHSPILREHRYHCSVLLTLRAARNPVGILRVAVTVYRVYAHNHTTKDPSRSHGALIPEDGQKSAQTNTPGALPAHVMPEAIPHKKPFLKPENTPGWDLPLHTCRDLLPVRQLHKSGYVQNQCHMAIRHDRRPGYPGNPLQQTPECLDDNLVLTKEFIHDQPGIESVVFDHDQKAILDTLPEFSTPKSRLR